MDMILLDWTRMGTQYCLAGAIMNPAGIDIVRPLPAKQRNAPVRNVGWSPYLMDGHARWDIFELIGPEKADVRPPHVEDIWVRSLRPRGGFAPAEQRRAILSATAAPAGQPVFGAPLTFTRSSAYLTAGAGNRSLATVLVPVAGICFSASLREGADSPDVRASLGIAPLDARLLPVKDHHLLGRAECAATNLTAMVRNLDDAVRGLGEQVAVRLGLSRPFQHDPAHGSDACWLMIDGIFSCADPQP
jgi:hypothetical protein